MKLFLRDSVAIVLLLFCLSIPFAAPASNTAAKNVQSTAAPFDTVAIHAMYLDGDFDKATVIIEKALNSKQPLHHGDSVFAFKHLGVMDAAQQSTREKGKYYMVQLLNLEPTAKILDMYASDMIYMIFKNIKEEFDESQMRLRRAEAHVQGNRNTTTIAPPDSTTKKNPPAQEAKSAGHSHLYWIGGAGAAILGVGVVAYMLEKPSPATRVTYDVQ